MTNETKQIILRALNNYRGDNLERAQAAFKNCTPEQMQQLYGMSTETRQEILDGYKLHVEKVMKAIEEINNI